MTKKTKEKNVYLNAKVELNKTFLIEVNGKSQEQIIEEVKEKLVEEVKKGNIEVIAISAECGDYPIWSLRYED